MYDEDDVSVIVLVNGVDAVLPVNVSVRVPGLLPQEDSAPSVWSMSSSMAFNAASTSALSSNESFP